MSTQLKVLQSSFIRMCQRDLEGKEKQQCVLLFYTKCPKSKGEVKGVCHTWSHIQTKFAYRIPWETVDYLGDCWFLSLFELFNFIYEE